MLGLICVFGIICLSLIMIYIRRLFKQYRYKLELYQHLLLKFIPDKLSEVAVQNRPDFPTIPEDEEEYDDTSSYYYYGGKKSGNRNPSQSITIAPPNLHRNTTNRVLNNDMNQSMRASPSHASSRFSNAIFNNQQDPLNERPPSTQLQSTHGLMHKIGRVSINADNHTAT